MVDDPKQVRYPSNYREKVDGLYTEEVIARPPDFLLTDQNGAGDHPRLRVDPGQTSFFDGREFRTFKEFDLATNAILVIKATAAIDTILFSLFLELVGGAVKIETIVGGTEGGTFTSMPVISANTMTSAPSYTAVNTVASGGTLTGGTVIDVLKLATSNQGAQSASVGILSGDERGVSPGVFFWRITSQGADNADGVIRARWEERPEGI